MDRYAPSCHLSLGGGPGDSDSPATLEFYTYDFPGWQATIDGMPVPHRTQPPYGLIALDVPPATICHHPPWYNPRPHAGAISHR